MKVEQREAIAGVRPFVEVATKGLARMYDPHYNRFCKRIVLEDSSVHALSHSTYESLIAWLGLYEAYHYDVPVPFDLPVLTMRYIEGLPEFSSLTELGIALWMTARSHPELLASLYERVNLSTALDKYSDARDGNTKALSCFLTGLSEIRLSDGEEPPQLDELAFMVRQMLFVNYRGFGVFRHAMKRSLFSRAALSFGTFQDQAFGMYAFSRFSRAFHDDQSLEIAAHCAKRLIENQGELGQWWHSYEVSAGQPARKYPIRSVNQCALAPMALNEIGKQIGLPVADSLEYGLQWMWGDNELHANLVDLARLVIWEGIFDTRYKASDGGKNDLKGLRPQKDKKRTLTISWECRPSELGWLLYALSGHLEG